MNNRFLGGSLAFLVIGTLVAVETRAAPPDSDAAGTKATARAHFERGVTLAREGNLEAAVAEFEGAYRVRPHYSVLYNLGQAHATMGHSVDAVDAFRRYLAEGGTTIDAARRAHVTELIAFHEKRIGSLRLDVQPEGAEIWLDGRLVGKSPLTKPVRLVAGAHGVVVRKEGLVELASEVDVAGGSTKDLELRAEARLEAETQGVLIVRCAVPDLEVSVDGNDIGSTSATQAFRVALGERTIRLARTGYTPDERTVDVAAVRPTEVECRLRPDGKGPRGNLLVRPDPIDGTIMVNGARFGGEKLPAGRHSVRVERSGYHTFASTVRIEPGRTANLAPTLKPTTAQQEAWKKERSDRTAWAVATTIGGVLLGGAAVTTYVWNSARYDDWLADRRALDSQFAQGPATSAMLEENADLNRRSLSIERADVAAMGLGVAGAVTLGISGALWVEVVGGTGER